MRKVWRRLLRAQRPGEKGRRGAESSGYKRRSANHHILRNRTWQMPSSVTAESFSAHMKVCAAHPSCTSQTCLRLFSLYFISQPFLRFRIILHSSCFLLRGNRATKTQTVELAYASIAVDSAQDLDVPQFSSAEWVRQQSLWPELVW